MPTTVLRTVGLSKRFGSACAAESIDLMLSAGEVRGLLGPNGAGKTTLLRLLLGLVAPDAGAVELFGQPRDEASRATLDGVAGFVEEPAFYPYLSGRANLEVLGQMDGGVRSDRIDDALAAVDLTRRAGERVKGYSTGMRQRLGIAAALMRGPRLLLLDEPTSGLDPAGVRDVLALVRELASTHGVAVLLSSHQIAAVEEVCDSFTVLRTGRVVWDGSAAELREQAPVATYRLVTSDDARALAVASADPDVRVDRSPSGALLVAAGDGQLDGYVFALGEAGVAVRRLELLVSSVESMFFALTAELDGDSARLERTSEHASTR